jgi:tripeptidyl-peptidase-1
MRFSTAVAAATLLLSCSAAPASSKHVVHEKRNGKPHQWEKRDRAVAGHLLPIKIGLRQRNLENAEQFMYDVSDPSSPNFGTFSKTPFQSPAVTMTLPRLLHWGD